MRYSGSLTLHKLPEACCVVQYVAGAVTERRYIELFLQSDAAASTSLVGGYTSYEGLSFSLFLKWC